METYRATKLQVLDKMKVKNITLFHLNDLKKLFPLANDITLMHFVRRLKYDRLVERLTRNSYAFLHAKRDISDFEIANFLLTPSYISLESALSYYGMLSQFPYRIISLTPLKPRTVPVRKKAFVYCRIKKEYFTGFIRQDHFLIASREKAIFDYLYFVSKGLRSHTSLEDLRVYVREKNVQTYLAQHADRTFHAFLKRYDQL